MECSKKTANHARRLFLHMLRSVQSSPPQATAKIEIGLIGKMRAETEVQSDKGFWRHDADVQCQLRSEHG